MCGISGIFDPYRDRPVDTAALEAMTSAIAHRGPDDAGYFSRPGVGLGHRRLSIIDLAGGHQPLFNEDETVCVVYNGEIYNFAELARELREAGHRFRTRCDTEVIVHAWEEWGTACVERFRGMFAFALFDANAQSLFLARDRLGIKPLHYGLAEDGMLVFGSELKALLAYPALAREIDPMAIEDFFAFGYIPDPRSIYASVQKLPPGHTLLLERGKGLAAPRPYWDLSFAVEDGRTEARTIDELRERLDDSVSARLVADVPLGAFLSGGVDSSGVVASMARLQDRPVDTCSIGFGEAAYDESRYAGEMARRIGARHHARTVAADDFGLLSRLANVYDEPFADSSALPTYRVCEEARRHVTVALSGDGGDEIFAGYRRYRWHHYEEQVRQRLPQAVRGPLFGLAGAAYPKMDWAPRPLRAKSTLQALAQSSAEGYFHSLSILPDAMREALYSPELKRALQGYRAVDLIRQHMAAAPTDHHLSRVQYTDMKTYLPGDILTKVDRASMAHSLEVRVPLLDHPFVEWAGGVSPRLKLHGNEGKYIFKKALEPDVPAAILYREKMGFSMPLSKWLRGPLRGEMEAKLVGGPLAATGYFDADMLETMARHHATGRRDYSAPIWALLMFAGFLERIHQVSSPAVARATAESERLGRAG